MKTKVRSVLVTFLTSTLGNTLVNISPKKVASLKNNGISLTLNGNLSFTERLMRRAILNKLEKAKDYKKLAQLHQNYWTNQGDDFVTRTQNNLGNIHLPNYKSILDVLKFKIYNETLLFEKFVEIGTGNGSVLNYLSSELSGVQKMIGIDLSEEQTKANKLNYKDNAKIEFHCTDILNWIELQNKSNMVLFTFRGVLEYFTQKQLEDFFKKLNKLGNIIFFAIEPNGLNHNFDDNPNSEIYGVESSFSHNHKKLFKDAGFNIWHEEIKEELNQPHYMSIIGAKNF